MKDMFNLEGKNDLEKVKEEIEKLGRKVIAIECDVTKEAQVKDAVRSIRSIFSYRYIA